MPVPFTLAAATDEDFQRLFELRLIVMQESLARIGRFDKQRAFERFRTTFRPQHTRLIIGSDGALVGCVAIGPSDNAPSGGTLLLEHFYILPEQQGRGLGGAVLRRLLDEADDAGLPIRLSVLQQSDAARFYERHGFAKTGADEWDVYYERQPRGRP